MVGFRVGDKIRLRYPTYDKDTVAKYRTFTITALMSRYVDVEHDFGKGSFTFDEEQIELVSRRNKITVNTRKIY